MKIEFQNGVIHFKDSKKMDIIEDNSVGLVVTSPPYFNFIEYGKAGIGMESSYDEYLKNLRIVFKECLRVLIPNGKFCINISNMKSRKSIEKEESFLYSIVSDVTLLLKDLGFIFFDEIIWIKGDANNGALGGKPLFGSYPYPPNPKILDSIFENILIFKKQGRLENRVSAENKNNSKLTKEEWMVYTKGIWEIKPDKISNHPASFPLELPSRLIKIYSFQDEIVLDPFAGTGTTPIAASKLNRKGIGFEIYKGYKKYIDQKIGLYLNQFEMFGKK